MTETACPPDEELVPLLAGDPAAATVRGHLDTCPRCRARLDQMRTEVYLLRSLPAASAAAAPAAAARPATIGKYLVVGALDVGGQSAVYRALHPTLDKELVIKLSHRPVGPDSDFRHLLVAEGKLLAGLEHPNLARVYDLDFHDD